MQIFSSIWTDLVYIMNAEREDPLLEVRGRLPVKLNRLAACRVCALVKDAEEFANSGCENCSHSEPLIWTTADADKMTTPMFSGYVI